MIQLASNCVSVTIQGRSQGNFGDLTTLLPPTFKICSKSSIWYEYVSYERKFSVNTDFLASFDSVNQIFPFIFYTFLFVFVWNMRFYITLVLITTKCPVQR